LAEDQILFLGVFVRFPDWSQFDISDPNWLAIILTLFGGFCVACYYIIPFIHRRTIYKYGNFNLCFLDHPPPDSTIHNFYFPYHLPVGTFRLCCSVQTVHGFKLSKVNFRFLNSDRTNVPISTIEILGLDEGECDEKRLRIILADTVGGIDGRYDLDGPSLSPGEKLYFWLTIKASQPWDGYLSFRGQNAEGFRSYGGHRVMVHAIPDSPLFAKRYWVNSPLKVEYEERVGSYYQEDHVFHQGLGDGILQIARIKVVCTRLEPISDVQVKVQRVVPEQKGLHGLPFHVQRMNDNTKPYQRSTVFTKDQEEYFDVVGYARFILSTGQLHLRRIDGAKGSFDVEPCEIFIRITGLGIDSLEYCFEVWVDEHNDLRMQWCKNDNAGRN
jgi:hypothetical protein